MHVRDEEAGPEVDGEMEAAVSPRQVRLCIWYGWGRMRRLGRRLMERWRLLYLHNRWGCVYDMDGEGWGGWVGGGWRDGGPLYLADRWGCVYDMDGEGWGGWVGGGWSDGGCCISMTGEDVYMIWVGKDEEAGPEVDGEMEAAVSPRQVRMCIWYGWGRMRRLGRRWIEWWRLLYLHDRWGCVYDMDGEGWGGWAWGGWRDGGCRISTTGEDVYMIWVGKDEEAGSEVDGVMEAAVSPWQVGMCIWYGWGGMRRLGRRLMERWGLLYLHDKWGCVYDMDREGRGGWVGGGWRDGGCCISTTGGDVYMIWMGREEEAGSEVDGEMETAVTPRQVGMCVFAVMKWETGVTD